jgi:uncharacterized protein with HEPN domain
MHEFIFDKLELLVESIERIELYPKDIVHPNEFKNNAENFAKLDAAMMRLQVIGENIKKISKYHPDFFESILSFDTNNIIRFRDFISHHYEKLDIDIIFEICKNDISDLKQKIQTFLSGNNESV